MMNIVTIRAIKSLVFTCKHYKAKLYLEQQQKKKNIGRNFACAINHTGKIICACASVCESDSTRLQTWSVSYLL